MDGKPQVTFPFFKIKCGTSRGYKVSTLWQVILLLGCDLWAGEHWHTLWISLWANLWITQTLDSRYHNTMAFAHESIFCAKYLIMRFFKIICYLVRGKLHFANHFKVYIAFTAQWESFFSDDTSLVTKHLEKVIFFAS